MKILMVCLGNICRSPIAEGVMEKLIKKNYLSWKVASAGTNSYHIGSPPHEYSINICNKNNVDIKHQRARRFQLSDLKEYDKIYAMAEDVLTDIKHISGSDFDGEKVTLFLNELFPNSNRSVTDPWYGEEDGYAEVYDIIERTCERIVEKYR
ncbi:MAG TPA: low molecular weight protein-tyrosine-phosphatase [Edaphocola sp.]|nr:low molecular weight protein-tyrosine-phosphatase [Edaphocola sp.]